MRSLIWNQLLNVLFVYKPWKEMEEEKITTQLRRCQFALHLLVIWSNSKQKQQIERSHPLYFLPFTLRIPITSDWKKHFHGISPDLIVLQSLETISRAPAGTHLQNIEFWFYALFLPLCRGYFDVYYTAGLIQIIVR